MRILREEQSCQISSWSDLKRQYDGALVFSKRVAQQEEEEEEEEEQQQQQHQQQQQDQ